VITNLRFALNGVRSPVNKLPSELLSKIFAHLRAPGVTSRHYPHEHMQEISDDPLTTVNLVCRHWRQTAIGAGEPNTHVAVIAAVDLEGQSKHDGGPRPGREKRAKSVDPDQKLEEWSKKVAVYDFEVVRMLGKGYAGEVLLVRYKPSSGLFALKAITMKHVSVSPERLQHTLTEQAVLKRMATEGRNPFIVKLWWSFHDREHLFLVTDFHPGGDLATQPARWDRLSRDRTRFYAAEIVEGVESLHMNGIIYRDLKPENVLIGSDGHIVLTDFGFSKEFPRRLDTITALPNEMETTSTFCGAAEYLAPEVIRGLPYSFEADWWCFGTMLYEMMTGVVCTLRFSA